MIVRTGPWAEPEYGEYLAGERHMFAWILVRHGGVADDRAEALARERYPYEPADAPYRGLIFHDEAWHWGMVALRGEQYWVADSNLASPPPNIGPSSSGGTQLGRSRRRATEVSHQRA
jgi:hypothetical protein